MHEMAIATELLQQVMTIAQEHQAIHVDEIVVEYGVMRQVVPEALELSFSVVAEGTVAEGARLDLNEKKIAAVCRQCESRFLPEMDNFACPQCNQADVQIVAGNEIILKSVICQAEDEVPAS